MKKSTQESNMECVLLSRLEKKKTEERNDEVAPLNFDEEPVPHSSKIARTRFIQQHRDVRYDIRGIAQDFPVPAKKAHFAIASKP